MEEYHLFVVAFILYPFANILFKEADIPKRLIPGTIALGAFTFTMTALPGSPEIQNVIPMSYFGTDTFAAPIHWYHSKYYYVYFWYAMAYKKS